MEVEFPEPVEAGTVAAFVLVELICPEADAVMRRIKQATIGTNRDDFIREAEAGSLLQKDAIKLFLKVGRIGIAQIKRRGGRRASADGKPLRQIGGGLEHIALIWRCGQLKLEDAIAE